MPTPLLKDPARLEIERIVKDTLGVGGTWQTWEFDPRTLPLCRRECAPKFICNPRRGSHAMLRLEDAGDGWWAFVIAMPDPLPNRTGQIHVSNLAAWLRVQFRTKPEKVAS